MISRFAGVAKDLLDVQLIREASLTVKEEVLFETVIPNCPVGEMKDFVRKYLTSKRGDQNIPIWPDLALVLDAAGSEIFRWNIGDEMTSQYQENMERQIKDRKAVMDNDKAMEEGKLAASQGEKASSNPYNEDSDEWGHWEEGFHFVKGSDEDGEPSDE